MTTETKPEKPSVAILGPLRKSVTDSPDDWNCEDAVAALIRTLVYLDEQHAAGQGERTACGKLWHTADLRSHTCELSPGHKGYCNHDPVAAPPAQPAHPYGGLCTCQHASDHSLPHEPYCAGYKQPAQPRLAVAYHCFKCPREVPEPMVCDECFRRDQSEPPAQPEAVEAGTWLSADDFRLPPFDSREPSDRIANDEPPPCIECAGNLEVSYPTSSAQGCHLRLPCKTCQREWWVRNEGKTVMTCDKWEPQRPPVHYDRRGRGTNREEAGFPHPKPEDIAPVAAPPAQPAAVEPISDFADGPMVIDCLHFLGPDGVCKYCERNILAEAAEAVAAPGALYLTGPEAAEPAVPVAGESSAITRLRDFIEDGGDVEKARRSLRIVLRERDAALSQVETLQAGKLEAERLAAAAPPIEAQLQAAQEFSRILQESGEECAKQRDAAKEQLEALRGDMRGHQNVIATASRLRHIGDYVDQPAAWDVLLDWTRNVGSENDALREQLAAEVNRASETAAKLTTENERLAGEVDALKVELRVPEGFRRNNAWLSDPPGSPTPLTESGNEMLGGDKS